MSLVADPYLMKIKYGNRSVNTSFFAQRMYYDLRVRGFSDYPINSTYPMGGFQTGSPSFITTGVLIDVAHYDCVSFISSSNTLGAVADGITTGFFLWNPYKREEISVLREPKLRRYNPPRFSKKRPVLRLPEEPVRRDGVRADRYRILYNIYLDKVEELQHAHRSRLGRYEDKLKRFILKKESYDRQYARSVARHKRRLNTYLDKLLKYQGRRLSRSKGDLRYSQGTTYSLFKIGGPVRFLTRIYYILDPYPTISSYQGRGMVEGSDNADGPLSGYSTESLIEATKFLSERYDTRLKYAAFRRLSNGMVSGGVILGESKETAELLTQIFKFLRHLRSSPLKLLKDASRLGEVNNLYLTQNFGVRPLIDDLKRVVQLFGTGIQVAGDVRCKTLMTFSLDRQYIPVMGGLTVSGRLLIYRTYKYSVANPFLRILETLGLLNLPSIAWELVPMSFVFDWFYNVGDFLAIQTATSGLEPLEAWETLDIQGYASSGTVAGVQFDPSSLISDTSFESEVVQRVASFDNAPIRIKVRRKISTDLDPDIPHIKLGDWPLSKLVTSLSLILQRVL